MGFVSCSIQIFTIEFDGIFILPSPHTNQLDRIKRVLRKRITKGAKKRYKGNPVPFSNHQCDFTSSPCVPFLFFSTYKSKGTKTYHPSFLFQKGVRLELQGVVFRRICGCSYYILLEWDISLNLRMLSHMNANVT